jgi:hypothetical protein
MIYRDLPCNRVYSCYHLCSCIRNALKAARRERDLNCSRVCTNDRFPVCKKAPKKRLGPESLIKGCFLTKQWV